MSKATGVVSSRNCSLTNRWSAYPHIIITITGPLQNRVARRVTNNLGVWINTEQVPFERFPSYYHVIRSTVSLRKCLVVLEKHDFEAIEFS